MLSLLATHSPEELNVVLVEAVGGTAFADFQDAPHVSALITDLAGDPELVDRLHDALSGRSTTGRPGSTRSARAPCGSTANCA
ncbi:hypothetical protein GCM10020366_70170 [Saccharopolyspora gregorii]|uniref:Uncharacterized protein n=1 Tax=Saccharopolyspora gregorii TaxID=33914 RepID=A0ABP6S2K3_9PSEU